jgi:UDP-GlcNAc:undecaprenyl-phosphate GlcNAc-1-phosphate transferase
MADFAVLAGLTILAALVTWALLRVRILDVPNLRSSHDRPVPRAGGIAIVVAFTAGVVWIGTGPLWTLLAGALVVALVGFLDDTRRVHVWWGKLAGQTVAVIVVLAGGIVLREIGPFGDIGWWGYPVTLIWLVGMTNLVNFMDGLDGIAGGSGAIAALAFAALALPTNLEVACAAAALGAGCVGFTLFNAPKARIFMGDVGSEFLGFVLAALAVYAAGPGAGHVSFLVMPLLMFHFLFDTCFTFCRRLRDGERVTQGHKGHLYQLMNRLGAGHIQVSAFYWAIGLAQALGAYVMLSIEGPARLLVFLPFLAFEAGFAWVVMAKAKRSGVRAG